MHALWDMQAIGVPGKLALPLINSNLT